MMKEGFEVKIIKGKGRGEKLGAKTLNFKVPQGFDLKRGVWKCLVLVGGKKYRGLLHYGPRPTFGEEEDSLEVWVKEDLGETEGVRIELGRRLRGIKKFETERELSEQIKRDWRTGFKD